tara:strand:- start:2219 stop:2869 length:651 start_codon:yes stop_codon:yes gene_type:complete
MFPTTQNSATDMQAMLAASRVQETKQGEGSTAYIRFDFKSGGFTFGKDHEDISGETIAVNISSFRHGWTLWTGGKPKKVQASFTQDLPMPMPSENGDSPTESRGFDAAFLDDEETILTFESNSYGGRKGADALLNAVKIRSAAGEANFLFPMIKLDSESYKAQTGGTIHNPVFTVVDWMDQAGNIESDTAKLSSGPSEDKATEEEVQPKRRRRAVA